MNEVNIFVRNIAKTLIFMINFKNIHSLKRGTRELKKYETKNFNFKMHFTLNHSGNFWNGPRIKTCSKRSHRNSLSARVYYYLLCPWYCPGLLGLLSQREVNRLIKIIWKAIKASLGLNTVDSSKSIQLV